MKRFLFLFLLLVPLNAWGAAVPRGGDGADGGKADCVDIDGDGTCEIDGTDNVNITLDADDDGTADATFDVDKLTMGVVIVGENGSGSSDGLVISGGGLGSQLVVRDATSNDLLLRNNNATDGIFIQGEHLKIDVDDNGTADATFDVPAAGTGWALYRQDGGTKAMESESVNGTWVGNGTADRALFSTGGITWDTGSASRASLTDTQWRLNNDADATFNLIIDEFGTEGATLNVTGGLAFDLENDGTDNAIWTGVSTDGFTLSGDGGNGDLSINASVGAVLDWSDSSTVTLDGSKAQLAATGSGDDVVLVADDEIQFDAGGGGADATFLATRATWTNLRHHTFAFDDSTCTIADSGDGNPGAGTCTPSAFNFLEVTCQDTDGCNLTVGETSVPDGMIAHWINVGTNTVNFADTAGVTELAGAYAAGQYDSITMIYVTTTWVEVDRSNN